MPGSTANGDVCTSDYVAVESCVPEGGARLCGNETGITRNYQIILKLFNNYYNK